MADLHILVAVAERREESSVTGGPMRARKHLVANKAWQGWRTKVDLIQTFLRRIRSPPHLGDALPYLRATRFTARTYVCDSTTGRTSHPCPAAS